MDERLPIPRIRFPLGGVGRKSILVELGVLIARGRPTFASWFLKRYWDHKFQSQEFGAKHSPTTSPPSLGPLGIVVVVVVFGVL